MLVTKIILLLIRITRNSHARARAHTHTHTHTHTLCANAAFFNVKARVAQHYYCAEPAKRWHHT